MKLTIFFAIFIYVGMIIMGYPIDWPISGHGRNIKPTTKTESSPGSKGKRGKTEAVVEGHGTHEYAEKKETVTGPKTFAEVTADEVFIPSGISVAESAKPCPYGENEFFGALRNTYLWKVRHEDPSIVWNAHMYVCYILGISRWWLDYFDVIGVDSRWNAREGYTSGAMSAFQFTSVNYKDAGIKSGDREFICSISLAEQYRYELNNMRKKLKHGAKPMDGISGFTYLRNNMFYHIANWYENPNAIMYSSTGVYSPISLPELDEKGNTVLVPVIRKKSIIIDQYHNHHNIKMDYNEDGFVMKWEIEKKSLELRETLFRELEVIFKRNK